MSGREIVAALMRAGFVFRRQKGSHQFFGHPEKRRSVIVAVHGSKPVPPGTLAEILRKAGLSVEEFIELLK